MLKQETISSINWRTCPVFESNDLSEGFWKKDSKVVPPPFKLVQAHHLQEDFSLTLPGNPPSLCSNSSNQDPLLLIFTDS